AFPQAAFHIVWIVPFQSPCVCSSMRLSAPSPLRLISIKAGSTGINSINGSPGGGTMTLSFRPPIILTGIPPIDQLHLEMADVLAWVSLLPQDEFCAGYGALLEKVEQAFAAEEMWMEETDYPGLRQHREQHARVLGG